MICCTATEINERGETDLPGLYCAGDECGNFNLGIAGAAVTGRIAGENAASYVQNVEGVSGEAKNTSCQISPVISPHSLLGFSTNGPTAFPV